MAPYRRRRPWTRRWRRWRRYPYTLRRRRQHQRRRKYPRRRVRVLRRRKKLASFWDPINKAKCNITGWDYGLWCRGSETVQRFYITDFTPIAVTKLVEGGGVSLKVFDLRYLYDAHRHFKNRWTHSNDGFDLAQYFGTTVYLKPHPFQDYFFFWDTDLKQEQKWDIIRMQPGNQLNSKNVVFIRSMVPGGNHKTKKIHIKPPANILNKWMLQSAWTDQPLFMFGFGLINWKEPFFRQDNYPVTIIKKSSQLYKFSGDPPKGAGTQQNFVYSPWVDTGQGNLIAVKWADTNIPPNPDNIKYVSWSADLPYYMTMFGQNKDMSFNIPNEAGTNLKTYIFFKWPQWTEDNITQGKPVAGGFVWWAGTAEQLRDIPLSGPFVQPNFSPNTRINIPFFYKSKWKWGGTQLVQQPINAIKPTSNQIAVKNPATNGNFLIYPWDLSGGILTKSALERLTGTYSPTDERRPVPFEEPTEGYAYPASDGEETSETEKSEIESDEEYDQPETSRAIRKLIQRKRNKHEQLQSFLKHVVKRHSVM
nr:ORF1 [Torque teno felis virus]